MSDAAREAMVGLLACHEILEGLDESVTVLTGVADTHSDDVAKGYLMCLADVRVTIRKALEVTDDRIARLDQAMGQ